MSKPNFHRSIAESELKNINNLRTEAIKEYKDLLSEATTATSAASSSIVIQRVFYLRLLDLSSQRLEAIVQEHVLANLLTKE